MRIPLNPGEKKSVSRTVGAEKLACWDEKQHAFTVEPGDYELFVGASPADIRATSAFAVR